MRKHFEGKKFSRERDYSSEDSRKQKKSQPRNSDKNWKNHLFDPEDEPADEDFFHFDEDEE